MHPLDIKVLGDIKKSLRLSKQHINNLDDVQINKPKRDWRDDDVFNGEDAQGVFGDPSIHDTSINSDMSFNAAYYNVAKEAKYKPTEPANFEFVMEGDAFPLPPKTGKSPKFEVEDIVLEGKSRRAILEQEKTDLEGQMATAESYMKSGEWQLEQEGMTRMEKAQEALDEVLTELDRLKMNGTTKKQGGGFIDSPLYLRDY